MKNSTLIKGTAAIAVGAALLLGGGGTLANWNAEVTKTPGTIIAGDLNVTAADGVWTDREGKSVNIGTYKVVPGDKLTYTQELTVKLVGDKMAATVTLADAVDNNFADKNVKISPLQLKNTAGDVTSTTVLKPVSGSSTQTVTASTTFEFLNSTSGVEDVTATYDLGSVKYTLQQVVAGQAGLF